MSSLVILAACFLDIVRINRQTNGGENLTPATSVGVGNKTNF